MAKAENQEDKLWQGIDKIMRHQAYIEARGRDDFMASNDPVSEETRLLFMNVLNETLEHEDNEIREATVIVKKDIESGELKLYQAPEIIYRENGYRIYVQLGMGIYLWDEDGGKRIPKEQLIEAIRAASIFFDRQQ